MKKPLLLLALLLGLAVLYCQPARAADLSESVHVAAGANGAWFDGPGTVFPADVEVGGVAWASLSPHLSVFADGFYGFSHSYVRWDGGVKATITDVDNPNLSSYVSLKYRGASIRELKPGEWAAGAGIGWKPNPTSWPRIVLGADAAYGLQSNRVVSYAAIRYIIPLK